MGKNNKEKPVNEHPNKIGIKEAMGYMLGDSGNLFVLTYVSYALKIFYTDVLKIAADKVATLFLVTRLWDAINDPLWGAIVAKRPPKKDGKYRPYLKWVAIPVALAQLACFYDISQNTSNPLLILAFAYVTYISFGMMYTGINVPFGSLASVITDDPEGRTLLSTFRSIGGGIGGAAPLLIAPLLIYDKHTRADGTTFNTASAGGMFKFALVMCILSIIFYFGCYATTKERVKSEAKPQFNVKEAYKGMFKSRPFVVLAVTGVLISGQLQFASYNNYLYKNYFENTNLSILGSIAQYLPMAIMILFTPKLVKRFGKKELAGFGSMFAAAAAIICYVVKPGRDQAWIFMLTLFIIGFGYSFVSITNWAVVADVIDYQFVKTGIRSESAVYAVYTFSRKLGQTIADYVGLMLLSRVGYTEEMAQIGYKEGVSEGILMICTLIPAITYTLIWLLYRFAYPLTKEKMEPIYKVVREENDALYAKDAEAEAAAE
ncbi:MAG: glycoside-pentoside-hexuronide (GPH):cation symporter [Clostridiales bacterium]|nr:glycoside-pentoside-hexuronide (GPH):cation symporter [Clostridiales bacterium]